MKTSLLNLFVLPPFLLSLFLVGCMSARTAGLSAEKGVLKVEDRAFASCIEVVQDQTTIIDGGFLKAQVTVRNTDKRNFDCQYRFVWKDKDGLTLKGADTLWRPLILHGREEAIVQGVSPVPRAADYRLVIRPMQNK